MQFLYPCSGQYPFDGVCTQIVLELERRNWQVPGIEVSFRKYGSGDQKLGYVEQIKARDFRLRFGRPQDDLPGGKWVDSAAVTELVIPKKELQVYSDESGPSFYLYVGEDYERDRQHFLDSIKVNSKLHDKPRTYLVYKGECHCDATWASSGIPHFHPRRRAPLLVHNDDLGREYDPLGAEPRSFKTAEVMEEFRVYLQEIVLGQIISQPVCSERIDVLAPPEPIPFPAAIGSLFCFGEHRDAERISTGQKDPSLLLPPDRYGLLGCGTRLVSWDILNDGTVPGLAYDGFLWCGIGEVSSEMAIDSLEIPGHFRWSDRERFVISVKPNRANGVFIADHEAYERRRKEVIESMGDRDRFTDAEMADFSLSRGRTIVPISEYKGGYVKPVVLINRELDLNEVEVVSGPHKDRWGR